MKKMVSRWSWLMALVLMVSFAGNVWAQSKPEPASIAFNFKLAELLKSDLGQAIPMDQVTGGPGGEIAEAFLKAQSIRGVVTLPEDVGAFMMMQGDQLPIDAYVELAYDDSSESKEALETIADELEGQSDIREEGDLRYFSPKGQETNIAIILGIPGKVVFLTDTYKHDSANFENVTDSIKDAMKKAGAAPAGIFLDFDQARPLIKSAIKMGRQTAPPAAAGFFEIPSQISLLQLVGNPGKEPALTLTAISPDEEQAEMLQETLQGLVGMGKMAMQQAPPDDPGAKVANGILGQLKPKREGKVVTLSLSKIEGLEDILP
ncbi:MAG: hypothetical protein JNL67_14575 [Planctomycetaceae bacterium]|nr:hypothetical protein [Planctomycetaceae bacterium]